MSLTFLRLGWFAWTERGLIARLALFIAAAVMVVPLTFALIVEAAVSGLPAPAGSPARPMSAWQVSQPFGCTGVGFEPARGDCPHFHSGIDLVGPLGAPVYAVLPGLVEVEAPAGFGGGYGIHVLVHHDPQTLTLYAHLLTADVVGGEAVVAGALLGHEGSTGLSTGPHLHFEVRRAGVPVDPRAVFPTLFGIGGPPTNSPAGISPRQN